MYLVKFKYKQGDIGDYSYRFFDQDNNDVMELIENQIECIIQKDLKVENNNKIKYLKEIRDMDALQFLSSNCVWVFSVKDIDKKITIDKLTNDNYIDDEYAFIIESCLKNVESDEEYNLYLKLKEKYEGGRNE